MIKKLLIIIMCSFLLVSCGAPDFTKEMVVTNKATDSEDLSTYSLSLKYEIRNGKAMYFSRGKIYAPYKFANVGDVIMYSSDDNTIKVVKKRE